MAGSRTREVADATRRPARLVAAVLGAVFLLVGILGFVPGITTDYGAMELAGHQSRAKLFGVFQVSVLHNLVHLLFGVAGLAAAWLGAKTARLYLLVGGLVYLVLWLYGLLIDLTTVQELFGPVPPEANFVPVNNADDWLHFFLGAGMITLWLVVRPGRGVRE
ncbi:DUF4383 domain-containing protein [Thermobifida halotolerans]|uniref:DUF4383 domain-containing protein n=1 Tax=Thermobifida halotolerans TaxID=483545 RepID=A0A399FZD9_9ACTN|nr:DUF4383 domain-containing protein [Thermobifida halotolerans]UOE21093.1 DUF4383 domain-containing protein [Thermobifida halotolerans]